MVHYGDHFLIMAKGVQIFGLQVQLYILPIPNIVENTGNKEIKITSKI